MNDMIDEYAEKMDLIFTEQFKETLGRMIQESGMESASCVAKEIMNNLAVQVGKKPMRTYDLIIGLSIALGHVVNKTSVIYKVYKDEK